MQLWMLEVIQDFSDAKSIYKITRLTDGIFAYGNNKSGTEIVQGEYVT